MASSLRPVSTLFRSSQLPSLRPTQPSTLRTCRRQPFSHSAPRNSKGQAPGTQTMKPKVPPQMSSKNRIQEVLRTNPEILPDDMGLLPGTFVRPLWKNFPSFFKEPKLFLRIAWLSVKFPVQNFVGLFAYCRYLNKKKLPLLLRERKYKAIQLHKEMYTAFAAGDKDAIRKICCQGLSQSFRNRISKRPRGNSAISWKLHKYITFPYSPTFIGARVVSDRASIIPGGEGMGIRQVVVRIRSMQSSSNKPPNAAPRLIGKKESEPVPRECTEYVVLQSIMLQNVPGDWKVWGLTEETTPEEVKTDPLFAGGVSLKDRFEALTRMRM